MKGQANRLIHSSSPYLLQHAYNPVDWYEWGDEAFEKARKEDKLLLVSIGYSSCHWCHVMEHESFEKEETAALMNSLFVNIKVDREERPDIDQIYMDAVQMLTGRGGWPLNVFILPDGRPVHGGTYFPVDEWKRVLQALANFYKEKKQEAIDFAESLRQGISKLDFGQPASALSELNKETFTGIFNTWKGSFDKKWGGFNWAPKFPLPISHEALLNYYFHSKDEEIIKFVNISLQRMANGGIYDQIGGGFSRYSVDPYWKVPHFEKMLYDNAQLISLYSHAYSINPDPLFKKIVYQTIEFLKREMQDKSAGFYSALDADSEGVEGKYYVWTSDEIDAILGNDSALFHLYYNVQDMGNWEDGVNTLYKTRSDSDLEKLTKLSINEIENVINPASDKLLKEREKRIRPSLDDKVICSWNALMCKALIDAANAFEDVEILKDAIISANFIQNNFLKENGPYRIYKNGKLSGSAFLEDLAMMADAFISLYQSTGEIKYLNTADSLIKECIENFYDNESGLFFFKSKKDVQLITRKLDTGDDVIPSGNSVIAKCLLYLSSYFSNNSYREISDKMLLKVSSRMKEFPSAYSNWVQLALIRSYGLYEIVITGNNASGKVNQIRKKYLPNAIIAWSKNGENDLSLFEGRDMNNDLIYVCQDRACKLPVTSAEEALKQLT